MSSLKKRFTDLILWSEKYTKTDMLYLVNGGLWLGAGQFITSLSAFLLSILFANFLTPDVFGTYKYILSTASLLSITTLTGMDSAVTQAVARGFDGTLFLAIKEKIKWSVIGLVFSIILSIYYFTYGNNELLFCFMIVAIFLPFVESLDMYNSLLWGKKLFASQSKLNVVKKIISFLFVAFAVIFTKNLFLILLIYFASIVLPNLVILFFVKRNYVENNNIDPDAISYGKHLSLSYIISTILSELDKILVFHYVGATDLAVYSLATAPIDQIKGLFKNINSLAFPKFSNKTSREISSTINHKIKILTATLFFVVISYIIVAPIFFSVFFPKYISSIKLSMVLSVSLIPVVISGFLYTVLEAKKTKKSIYSYNLYSNLFGIIILFPLVYYYGLWGAVISKIVTRFFGLAYINILFKQID